MTWYAWLIVAALVAGALLNVRDIGKPRGPITPAAAMLVIVANALMIYGVVALALRGAA
jgi:hypothetical protein